MIFKNYDYKRIYLWLEALDYLNQESNFSPAIASYYYSQTQNKEDTRLIVKFINQHSAKSLNKKWWWIVQSSDIASRIPDIDLAISSAELIANNNFEDAPLWTRTISTMLKAKKNGNHDGCFVFQVLKKLLEENESGARPINADEMNFMNSFYSANGINIGWIGNWNSVEIKSTDSSIDRLSNGQYLITATFNLGYLNESDFVIPTGSRGYDLADAPKSITTRILMNAGKTQVLAQAVQVNN